MKVFPLFPKQNGKQTHNLFPCFRVSLPPLGEETGKQKQKAICVGEKQDQLEATHEAKKQRSWRED